MLKNGLLSKVFIVIFLTLLNASFSYAEEENTSNPLAKNNDASICSFINELASPEQKFIDEANRRGINCEKSATYQPLPEKAPESSLNSFLMIGVFLFILFNVAFKFGMSPKPTIKLRPFPRKKPSTPSSEESSKPLASQNRPEVKAHSSDFDTQLTQQTGTIKSLRSDLSDLKKDINDMSQTFMTLKTSLDQKDEEISRYKNGYDATIFKNFLLRFTRVDKVIKEYIGDNKIDLNGLQDIQIQMDDALAECDVEIYIPEIGLNYKMTAGLEDNPEIRETLEKSKDATITEILMPGYRRKLPNDGYQVIIEAKVAILVYKKK